MNKFYRLLILTYFILSLSLSAQLSIMTYNIHAFPYLISGNQPQTILNKIEESSYPYDIVFIQENWIFNTNYFNNQNSKYNWIVSKNNSGLSFAFHSDLKTIFNHEEMFSECSGWLFNANDCWASKGFMHSIIEFEGSNIHLYNTHLDAGISSQDGKVRNQQLSELLSYINNISKDNPLIICGDFNYNYKKSQDSLIIIDFMNQLDLKNIDWISESNYQGWMLDYVFYRSSKEINIDPIEVQINFDLIDLSDHPPIQVKFEILKLDE